MQYKPEKISIYTNNGGVYCKNAHKRRLHFMIYFLYIIIWLSNY